MFSEILAKVNSLKTAKQHTPHCLYLCRFIFALIPPFISSANIIFCLFTKREKNILFQHNVIKNEYFTAKLIAGGALFLQDYSLLFHKIKGQQRYQVLPNTIKKMTGLIDISK